MKTPQDKIKELQRLSYTLNNKGEREPKETTNPEKIKRHILQGALTELIGFEETYKLIGKLKPEFDKIDRKYKNT